MVDKLLNRQRVKEWRRKKVEQGYKILKVYLPAETHEMQIPQSPQFVLRGRQKEKPVTSVNHGVAHMCRQYFDNALSR